MRRFELVKAAKDYVTVEDSIKKIEERAGIRVVRTYEEPRRQTKKSAGYDFYSPENFDIYPGQTVTVKTGYKAYMLDDEFLMIAVRSSMGYAGIELINYLGIIDADYVDNETNDGEIMFKLRNNGISVYNIEQGDRIGQGVFLKYGITDNDNPVSDVRTGPSGSTGK